MFSFSQITSHHYFKYCKISALALLKMVMHARSGGNLEVMGLMLGKVDGETMIIMDSFALPVEGTETRVNAQAAAYEYMAAYIENAKQVGSCYFIVKTYTNTEMTQQQLLLLDRLHSSWWNC